MMVMTFVSPPSRSATHGHAAVSLPALSFATRTTPAMASGANVLTDGWTTYAEALQGMRVAGFAVSVTPPLADHANVELPPPSETPTLTGRP